jgi:selenide, water dikinase
VRTTGPVTTDVVLVGGGHAHVQVMTAMAMAARPGLRVTLVTPDFETPYSGMLPGHLAGLYDRDAIHIDLARLAFATGTRLVQARATGVDREARRVLLEGRPPISYDLLSLDVGIVPDLSGIAGADRYAIPVKPISGFLDRFASVLQKLPQPDGPRRFLVVGGGAAGVELAMALHRRLLAEARAAGLDAPALGVELATAAKVVPTLNPAARRRVVAALAGRGIRLHEDVRVASIAADHVTLEGGGRIEADAVIVSTKARAAEWLGGLGLETGDDGSLVIGRSLQTTRDPRIFAVGDCAVLREDPREKAGVFAVRQGPLLAENLMRLARKRPLREWRPQRRYLVLLSTGDGAAIASRGSWFAASGGWVWRWKDWIDRRFMRMFHRFGRMGPARPDETGAIPAELRCGGCAAKIGPAVLAAALARLSPAPPGAASRAGLILDGADDAAVIRAADGRIELETLDLIRAFVSDPYLFGGIAALHALSDIHAMGGTPLRALALAQLPHGLPEKTAEDLFQLLSGARAMLDREGVALAGGHSAEAADMAMGFAVTGEADPASLRRKGGLRAGDALVLTKPLGIGVIYAAAMRGAAPGSSIAAALASQQRSNRDAAAILVQGGATALTDVTGFGLAGHLAEMLAAPQGSGEPLAAEIEWAKVPLLPGADALARLGFESSLAPANRDGLGRRLPEDLPPAIASLVADPQTSGGLLAAIPPENVDRVLRDLLYAGYQAARVGSVMTGAPGAILVRDTVSAPGLPQF